jgi:hypothetical protein
MDQPSIRQALSLLTHAKTAVDPEQVVVSYDHDSDTLMVHLFGRGVPAVSVLVNDELMVRWDRANERVVGFQIEHFLSRMAPQHPELLDLLDIAELHGIAVEDIGRIRRDIAQWRRGLVVERAVSEVDTITAAAD